jgi:hypothetical protein
MIGWLRGNAAMRALAPVGLVLAAALLLPAPAAAENRTFIIANYADGYGVDRCLATGEQCGDVVATSYCQSQSFAKAQSFRKVDRDEITGAVPTSGKSACAGASCDSFVAITCSR